MLNRGHECAPTPTQSPTTPTPTKLKASAPTQLGSLHAMAFQQRFPPHSYFRLLAAFGAGKALGELLEGLAEVRVRACVW